MRTFVASFCTSLLLVSGCGARNALPIGASETSSSSANATGSGTSVTSTTTGGGVGGAPSTSTSSMNNGTGVTSTTSGAGGGQPPVCTDVAGTFSGVDNPNGSWSYGWWSTAPPAG